MIFKLNFIFNFFNFSESFDTGVNEKPGNEEEKENEDELLAGMSTTPTPLASAPATVLQEPTRKEVRKDGKEKRGDPVETAILEFISEKRGTGVEDPNTLFGRSVGATLNKLSSSSARMAKVKIQQVLFEMEERDEAMQRDEIGVRINESTSFLNDLFTN